MSDVFIAWASPSAAEHYREAQLGAEDAARALQRRSAKAQQDWRVSRALLHAFRASARAGVYSLSHSHGHAICGIAPAGWKIGVDMERIKAREVLALADWVCSPYEKESLRGLGGLRQLTHFYMLWTLKEAFIKAAGLRFMADMPKVGLRAGPRGQTVLNAPSSGWQACAWGLGAEWVTASVWQVPEPSLAREAGRVSSPVWQAMPVCALPQRTLLGAWHCL